MIPDNKSFCAKAFLHQHVDVLGKNRLCCHNDKLDLKNNQDYNHQNYKDIRKDMLEGISISTCIKCYDKEQRKEVSPRIAYNKESENLFKEELELNLTLDNINPIDYDLRLRNLCNLTCIMCGPNYSSAWAIKTGKEQRHRINNFKDFNINTNVKRIYLAGGEPFLIKEYEYFLAKIKNKDCEIIINTNLTIWNNAFINLVTKFNNVVFIVSMDGLNKFGEYIRNGMIWQKFLENLDKLKKLNFNIYITSVFQKDNSTHFIEIANWMYKNKLFDWNIIILTNPKHFHWSQGPTLTKEYIIELISHPIMKKNLKAAITMRSLLSQI